MQCSGCKKFFKQTNTRQKYCNKNCWKKYYKPVAAKNNSKRAKIVYKTQIKRVERRICLSCNGAFQSFGKFNRICDSCKRDPKFSFDTDGYYNTNGRKR